MVVVKEQDDAAGGAADELGGAGAGVEGGGEGGGAEAWTLRHCEYLRELSLAQGKGGGTSAPWIADDAAKTSSAAGRAPPVLAAALGPFGSRVVAGR